MTFNDHGGSTKSYAYTREHQKKGEVVTGSLYNLPHAQLCPGNDALQKLMQQFR